MESQSSTSNNHVPGNTQRDGAWWRLAESCACSPLNLYRSSASAAAFSDSVLYYRCGALNLEKKKETAKPRTVAFLCLLTTLLICHNKGVCVHLGFGFPAQLWEWHAASRKERVSHGMGEGEGAVRVRSGPRSLLVIAHTPFLYLSIGLSLRHPFVRLVQSRSCLRADLAYFVAEDAMPPRLS